MTKHNETKDLKKMKLNGKIYAIFEIIEDIKMREKINL
jgi:hypothetical protein